MRESMKLGQEKIRASLPKTLIFTGFEMPARNSIKLYEVNIARTLNP